MSFICRIFLVFIFSLSFIASCGQTSVLTRDRDDFKRLEPSVSAVVLDRTSAGDALREEICQSQNVYNALGVEISTRQILNNELNIKDPYEQKICTRVGSGVFSSLSTPLIPLDTFQKTVKTAIEEARKGAQAFQAFYDHLSPQEQRLSFRRLTVRFLCTEEGRTLSRASETAWRQMETERKVAKALYPELNPQFESTVETFTPLHQANIKILKKAFASLVRTENRQQERVGTRVDRSIRSSTTATTSLASPSWFTSTHPKHPASFSYDAGPKGWDTNGPIEEKEEKNKEGEGTSSVGTSEENTLCNLLHFVTNRELQNAKEALEQVERPYLIIKQNLDYDLAEKFDDPIRQCQEEQRKIQQESSQALEIIQNELQALQESLEKGEAVQKDLEALKTAITLESKRLEQVGTNPNIQKKINALIIQATAKEAELENPEYKAFKQKQNTLLDQKNRVEEIQDGKVRGLEQKITSLKEARQTFIDQQAQETDSIAGAFLNAEKQYNETEQVFNAQKNFSLQMVTGSDQSALEDLNTSELENWILTFKSTLQEAAQEVESLQDLTSHPQALLNAYIETHQDGKNNREIQIYLHLQEALDTLRSHNTTFGQTPTGIDPDDLGALSSSGETVSQIDSLGESEYARILGQKIQTYKTLQYTQDQKERDRLEKTIEAYKTHVSLIAHPYYHNEDDIEYATPDQVNFYMKKLHTQLNKYRREHRPLTPEQQEYVKYQEALKSYQESSQRILKACETYNYSQDQGLLRYLKNQGFQDQKRLLKTLEDFF